MGKTQLIGLIVLIVIIGISVYRGVFQPWILKRRNKVNFPGNKNT
jgi:hypothetical protein